MYVQLVGDSISPIQEDIVLQSVSNIAHYQRGALQITCSTLPNGHCPRGVLGVIINIPKHLCCKKVWSL